MTPKFRQQFPLLHLWWIRVVVALILGLVRLASAEEPTLKSFTFKKLDGDTNGLQADVHQPRGDGAIRPVIVFIHGGALMMGDRKMKPSPGSLLKTILDAGYVVVSIDYRLAPQVKLPTIIE